MHSFTICDAPQRSPEWFAARAGRLTGSRAKDMLATIKSGGPSASRRDLLTQLVVERLTGRPEDDGNGYVNAAMQWGTDHEDEAFAAYEALTGHVAVRTGFLAHRDLMAGCSLDGHVGEFEGIVELKCPKSATHWGCLRGDGGIPPEHLAQVRHNLWISGARWCHFLSFDPRFPPGLRTFLAYITPEDANVGEYSGKAVTFLAEVDREVAAAKGWTILEQEQPC